MRHFVLNLARSIGGDQRGVTLVEYGIAIGLAIAVGVVLLNNLAVGINANVNSAGAVMT